MVFTRYYFKKSFLLLICLMSLGLLPHHTLAASDDCEPTSALKRLSNKAMDIELRGQLAACLAKYHLGKQQVSQAILKILSNEEENIFVREDILSSLSQISFRKSVKVEQAITPEISKQEAHAVDRTLASAKTILDVTKAVKSMNDVVPLTSYESDYVAILTNYVIDDKTEVELRIAAVQALSNISQSMIDSGLYEEKLLLTVFDAFRKTTLQDDAGSYYSGAHSAYQKLQNLFQKYAFNSNRAGAKTGRQISSIPR